MLRPSPNHGTLWLANDDDDDDGDDDAAVQGLQGWARVNVRLRGREFKVEKQFKNTSHALTRGCESA